MSTFVIRSLPLYKTRYNTRSVVGVGGDVRGGGDVVILCWPPPQPRRMIVPNNTLKTRRAISCLFEKPEATPLTARRILRRAARVPSRTFLADIRPIIIFPVSATLTCHAPRGSRQACLPARVRRAPGLYSEHKERERNFVPLSVLHPAKR